MKYTYNLKKLLRDAVIPELSNLIIEELISFGETQFIKYNDGGMQLNLATDKELTESDLNEVKNIILNHDSLKYNKLEKIKKLKQNANSLIEQTYPLWKQGNLRALKYGLEKLEEMEKFIDKIIAKVNSIESSILSKKKKETIDLIDVDIK